MGFGSWYAPLLRTTKAHPGKALGRVGFFCDWNQGGRQNVQVESSDKIRNLAITGHNGAVFTGVAPWSVSNDFKVSQYTSGHFRPMTCCD